MAVQGGLLASAINNQDKKYRDTSLFLISKVVIHTLLGGILGLFGSALVLSAKFQGILQILIGVFMLATAGRLLNLHPIFRITVIQPPVSFLRFIKKKSSEKDLGFLSPIILGGLTVLIPCGVTQAMLLLAIGTGNFLSGALIMFFFVLGTSPVFFALGVAISNIFKNNLLTKIAALVVFALGLMSINNGQVLRGSIHTFQNYKSVLSNENKYGSVAKVVNGVQEVEIIATNNGYQTDTKTLKRGVPVRLKVVSKNVFSCARSFIIPSMNINKLLPSNGTEIIEFTPNEDGNLTFSCGMGMYTGSFDIIK